MRLSRVFLLLLLSSVRLAHAATYYVSVAGLGGAPDYETQFSRWAADLDKELNVNPSEVHVTTLAGSASTKQQLLALLTRLATEAKPDDAFALFLIGHGTFDGEEYKFNLPGPDITATELAVAVNRIPAKRQLIVNMTSCSGASLKSFSRKDRIVITATKSGTEKNAPVFARYWVDSLRDPAADLDKNGTVTVQEAFNYAQRKTAAYFESAKLLATEHPLLTDSTRTETAAADSEKPISRPSALAAAYPLLKPQSAVAQTADPSKQRLLTRKEDLEAKIDKLKFEKAALPAEAYRQQLTTLLLELAKTQAEIDKGVGR